jgi:hypothetical protein
MIELCPVFNPPHPRLSRCDSLLTIGSTPERWAEIRRNNQESFQELQAQRQAAAAARQQGAAPRAERASKPGIIDRILDFFGRKKAAAGDAAKRAVEDVTEGVLNDPPLKTPFPDGRLNTKPSLDGVPKLGDAAKGVTELGIDGIVGGPLVRVGGKAWRAFQPGDKACQSGCGAVARAIARAIGGEIRTIRPPEGVPFLGRVRNSAGNFINPAGEAAYGWDVHEVVVKNGRVYDAFTGPSGLSVEQYKSLWENADAILFGF